MKGPLDNITILRYAHVFRQRTSGGAEQYLKQLNQGLLVRNEMTILQMHLVNGEAGPQTLRVEHYGLGRIIWLPVNTYNLPRSLGSVASRARWIARETSFLSRRHHSPRIRLALGTLRRLLANSCGHLRHSIMVLSERLIPSLKEYSVDLVAFHWLSYDVGTLVAQAEKRSIPYVCINHFDNQRLALPRTRAWLDRATSVGGVSGRGVPAPLQERYVNLSDAVDSEFFSAEKARPITRPPGLLLLLPARIIGGKGHHDLLLAAKKLSTTAPVIRIAFAGATDSEPFADELRAQVDSLGLPERVLFLGQLTSEELRDWYAASDVVVLPSHTEGLGRVLLEAQAMGRPVIAYDAGGMPDAVKHQETGLLVKVGDIETLAGRIKDLLLNPARRKAMGNSGRRFVLDHFSTAALVRRHESFYLEALARSRNGAPSV